MSAFGRWSERFQLKVDYDFRLNVDRNTVEECGRRPVKLSSAVVMAPGQGKLDVRFGAIQFRSPEDVRFRYRLNELDAAWTETNTRHASYTGLPAGRYRFDLIAFDPADPYHVSNASFGFEWRPHFYRTWWFYTACVAFACTLAAFMYRARMRQAQARFQAVLGERNRLAREMHDTLIQGCTGLSAVLEGAASMANQDGQAAETLLNCARTQIRAITDEARSAVWNLHNGGQRDILDVTAGIATQACDGGRVRLRIDCTGKSAIVDPMLEHEVIMVVREALFNAIRHGRPNEIVLQAELQNGHISVSIHDDGCGFDTDGISGSNSGHFGLIGMRERMERIGGSLHIASSVGKGSEVRLRVPVHGFRHKAAVL